MNTHKALKILVKPKPTKVIRTFASGIAIGLVITLMLGVFTLDPAPRLFVGLTVTILISTWQFREITAKNRRRAKELEKVLLEPGEIKVTRVTTNPIKPGKSFLVASGNHSVTIPEKRWVKIEPHLTSQWDFRGLRNLLEKEKTPPPLVN